MIVLVCRRVRQFHHAIFIHRNQKHSHIHQTQTQNRSGTDRTNTHAKYPWDACCMMVMCFVDGAVSCVCSTTATSQECFELLITVGYKINVSPISSVQYRVHLILHLRDGLLIQIIASNTDGVVVSIVLPIHLPINLKHRIEGCFQLLTAICIISDIIIVSFQALTTLPPLTSLPCLRRVSLLESLIRLIAFIALMQLLTDVPFC